MKLTPLKTKAIIQPGESLIKVLVETIEFNHQKLKEGSIIVIAETLIATTQNRIVNLANITEIRPKAKNLAEKYSMDPRFVEIIVQEADHIFGGLPGLLLTEKNGVLIANSGIDKSNSGPEEHYSLWPEKPFETAFHLCNQLRQKFNVKNLGIIISDSRVQPMKRGVIGVAIGVAGFDPLINCIGKTDLFGHTMEFTVRALADQLADAAHIVMGECDERTPFVLIENPPVEFTLERIDPKIMIMPKDQDLFIQILSKFEKHKEK